MLETNEGRIRYVPFSFFSFNSKHRIGKLRSIFALLLFIVLSGCTDRNGLRIHNYTKSDITVVSAKLDGKIISNRALVIPPTQKDHYSFVPGYTSFRSVNPRVLEVEIKGSVEVLNASCNLGNIRKQGGCLFLVSYDGTNQLKCVCDPYADFND